MTLAGGKFISTGWEDAIVDDNLVTAPAWTAHPNWLAEFVKKL